MFQESPTFIALNIIKGKTFGGHIAYDIRKQMRQYFNIHLPAPVVSEVVEQHSITYIF
jgi:hypothetical protein